MPSQIQQWYPSFIHVCLFYIGSLLLALVYYIGERKQRKALSRRKSVSFVDPPKLTPTPSESVGLTIRQFLKDLNFDIKKPKPLANKRLEDDVRAFIHNLQQTESLSKHLLRLVPLCAASTDIVYPNHVHELKLYITIFTVFFIYIDDCAASRQHEILDDLQVFALKLSGGVPEIPFRNPNVQHYINHLTNETPKWFGSYQTGIILKSVVDALLGAQLEAQYPEGIQTSRSGVRFSRFLRAKTGNSEAYAAFLWPAYNYCEDACLEQLLPIAPDMVEIIDTINDIMSFYKESVVGTESNTYFINTARALGCSPVEVMASACERQKELIADVRNCLGSTGTRIREHASGDFELFLDGYLTWHLAMDRYRLSDLGLSFGGTL